MHNWPGMPVGQFSIRPGAFFAAADQFEIEIEGKGGHAAKPHVAVDTTVIAANLVLAMQTIASRNTDPVKQIVVSITSFETSSTTHNVIPQTVLLKGTVRTMDQAIQKMAEERIVKLAESTADAFGGEARVDYMRGYPVMANSVTEPTMPLTQPKRCPADAMMRRSLWGVRILRSC